MALLTACNLLLFDRSRGSTSIANGKMEKGQTSQRWQYLGRGKGSGTNCVSAEVARSLAVTIITETKSKPVAAVSRAALLRFGGCMII